VTIKLASAIGVLSALATASAVTRPYSGHEPTVYTARTLPCRQSVYTCGWPCTRAVNSRVHGPYTAINGPCTRPCSSHADRVHGSGRNLDPVHSTQPCTRAVNTTVHSRIRSRVHGPYIVVYGPCTRPCSVHIRPCTRAVDGCVHGTRPCSRTVNTAMFTACMHVDGP